MTLAELFFGTGFAGDEDIGSLPAAWATSSRHEVIFGESR